MSTFTVRGRFQSRGGWEVFETTVEAPNEAVAREHVYANIGSQHGLKRRQVDLEEVEAT